MAEVHGTVRARHEPIPLHVRVRYRRPPRQALRRVSDSVLDACLAQDPTSRVACETFCKTGFVIVGGEITTRATVDFGRIARQAIKEIGYTGSDMGFDWETCAVMTAIEPQSPDISQGVTEGEGLFKEQGAATRGSCSASPATRRRAHAGPHHVRAPADGEARAGPQEGEVDFLRPDGKSQVTVEYDGDR